MNAEIKPTGAARSGRALADLSESLVAVNDMLKGVDALLAGGQSQELRRSARALVGLATDMVEQARDLVGTLDS